MLIICSSRGLLDTLLLYTLPTSSVGVAYPAAVDSLNRLALEYRVVGPRPLGPVG
jgi:hypothetical protein